MRRDPVLLIDSLVGVVGPGTTVRCGSMHLFRKTGLTFIRIPKTAGTAMELALQSPD